MPGSFDLIEVVLDTTHVAFRVDDVQRVIRCVAVEPVAGGPRCLLGMFGYVGSAVPLYDTRRLMGLSSRPLRASDRILLTHAPTAGLLVDDVLGMFSGRGVDAPLDFATSSAGVRGVVSGPNGMLMVQDMRRLLGLVQAVPIVADGVRDE